MCAGHALLGCAVYRLGLVVCLIVVPMAWDVLAAGVLAAHFDQLALCLLTFVQEVALSPWPAFQCWSLLCVCSLLLNCCVFHGHLEKHPACFTV